MSKFLFVFVCFLGCINTVYSQRAQLKSAMINGCGSPDGASEYLIAYSGSTSFIASSSTINVQYSPISILNLFTLTDSFVSGGDATFVSNLNGHLSSCDFSFINVNPGTTSIPAGSYILILNDDVVTALDFSAWCGQNLGNVYVLFSDDSSWPSNGAFANAPFLSRFLRSNINGTQTDFIYSDNWASNVDGNYVLWSDGGGAGAVYSNYSGCEPDNVTSLPVTLLSFAGHQIADQIEIEWQTASEENNSHFTVFRSSNGSEWDEIRMLSGKGTTLGLSNYVITDTPSHSGRWYYRLKQTDYNGEFEFFEIISILFEGTETNTKIFPNPANSVFNVMSENPIKEVWMINSFGHMMIRKPVSMHDQVATFSIADLPSGMYYLILRDELGQGQRIKLMVRN